MASSLAGKTAIVTGAGSGTLSTSQRSSTLYIRFSDRYDADFAEGINFCFARLLLKNQCNVVLADLALRSEAQELVSEYSLDSSSKAKAVFQQTDVREWKQLERIFAVATEHFGGVDIVCPGAGVFEPVRLPLTAHIYSPLISDNSPSPPSGILPATYPPVTLQTQTPTPPSP